MLGTTCNMLEQLQQLFFYVPLLFQCCHQAYEYFLLETLQNEANFRNNWLALFNSIVGNSLKDDTANVIVVYCAVKDQIFFHHCHGRAENRIKNEKIQRMKDEENITN